jgi:hypothetical protein
MDAKKLFGVIVTAVIVSLVVLPACSEAPEALTSPVSAETGVDGEPDPLSWIRDFLASIDLRGAVRWVMDNLDIIALVGALVAGWIVDGVKSARELAVGLMLDAEKRAKDQVEMDGPEKMEHVLTHLTDQMPARAQRLFDLYARIKGTSREVLIREVAQEWYDTALSRAGA